VTVRGKKDVAGCNFSPGGENAISSAVGVLGGSRRRMNLSDRSVGLEVQGFGFDE
jgi:hypothetical protein